MRGFEVAVKAGIVHAGRILVLTPSEPERRHEHDLPGGRMNYGEHPLTSLRREVWEETGLDIELVAPVRMWSMIRTNGQQVIGVTWACQASSATVELSDEHISYSWRSPDEIPDEWPEHAELLAVFRTLAALMIVKTDLASVHVDSIAGKLATN